MKQLPIKTPLSEIDVAPVFGQSPFRIFGQTIRILENEPGGKELKLFFAEPSISEIERVIYWRTRAQGEIHAWSELNQSEKLAGIEQIKTVYQRIQVICESISRVQGQNALGAEALRRMLVTPSLEQSLFLVGTQFVLTQWGCRPHGREPSEFDLQVQGKKASTDINSRQPNPSPPANPAEEPTGESSLPSPAPPQESAPTQVDSEPPAPDFNHEMLATSPVIHSQDSENSEPQEPPLQENHVEEKPSYWRWLILLLLLLLLLIGLTLKKWTYTVEHDKHLEQRHREEIAALWKKIDEKSKTCTAAGREAISPLAQTPPTKPQPLTRDALERNEIKIFEGGWVLITDLFNALTKEKVRISFLFDARGNGTAITREADDNICHGDASVLINSGNRFTVHISPQKCKTGGDYGKNIAECVVSKDNKHADCTLQCKTGSCGAVFERQ